jgi:hypothetical protein
MSAVSPATKYHIVGLQKEGVHARPSMDPDDGYEYALFVEPRLGQPMVSEHDGQQVHWARRAEGVVELSVPNGKRVDHESRIMDTCTDRPEVLEHGGEIELHRLRKAGYPRPMAQAWDEVYHPRTYAYDPGRVEEVITKVRANFGCIDDEQARHLVEKWVGTEVVEYEGAGVCDWPPGRRVCWNRCVSTYKVTDEQIVNDGTTCRMRRPASCSKPGDVQYAPAADDFFGPDSATELDAGFAAKIIPGDVLLNVATESSHLYNVLHGFWNDQQTVTLLLRPANAGRRLWTRLRLAWGFLHALQELYLRPGGPFERRMAEQYAGCFAHARPEAEEERPAKRARTD